MAWRLLPSILAIVFAAVLVDSLPDRPDKPNIPPSYDLHVSSSWARGNFGSEGADYWVKKGFDLGTIVSMVYEKAPSRIVLPPSLDNQKRYDFVLVLPREMDRAATYSVIQKGIEKYFRVSTTTEDRSMDVYVLTAVEGKAPVAKSETDRGASFTTVRSVTSDGTRNVGISAANTTMEDFRRVLEKQLNRPIVDETNLKGTFDFFVDSEVRTTQEFLDSLRDQSGLVLTPAHQNVEMLVFKPLP